MWERIADWYVQMIIAFKQTERDHLLVVFYENLKSNPGRELYRIARFLGVRVNDDRVKCTLANSHGLVERPKRKSALPKTIFSTREIAVINNRMFKVYKIFKRFHVPDIPDFYRHPGVESVKGLKV